VHGREKKPKNDYHDARQTSFDAIAVTSARALKVALLRLAHPADIIYSVPILSMVCRAWRIAFMEDQEFWHDLLTLAFPDPLSAVPFFEG